MRTKEDIIRDKRTVLATQKHYMGAAGKIGLIARILGDQIITQGGGGFLEGVIGVDMQYEDLGREFNDDDELPTYDPTGGYSSSGFLFNGYSRGYHLEVKFTDEEIEVRWKGFVVYREESGLLNGFNPGDWEPVIEKLYKEAKEKYDKNMRVMDDHMERAGQRRKEEFLEQMKRKWGL